MISPIVEENIIIYPDNNINVSWLSSGQTLTPNTQDNLTVTDSKLGWSLNDDCVLPGWARDLCTAVYLKINLTKFHSPTWNSLVLAANLSKTPDFYLGSRFFKTRWPTFNSS
jgi:hypothetical protein